MSTRRISDFEVLELLGEGAMGQVFKALDINLDRPVAIKLLSNRTFGDKTFLERFRREARLAAKLNHSNIATIYAFGEDNGEPYIAMEFVEGETLEQRIRRKSLSISEVRKFGEQASSALAAAHDLGIIHRDIKPANLMITKGGDLKVMDFGVARRTGETSLTMAGSLIGTANIMAPELIKGKEATPAADLFSLGCVLYECVAGLPAFHGEDPMAVLYKISNEDPRPLKDLRTDTPDDLVTIIGGLLVKEPEKRLGPSAVVAARIAGKALPAANETMDLGSGDLGTMALPEPDTQAGTLVADEGKSSSDGWFKKNRNWLVSVSGVVALILVVISFPKIMKTSSGELEPATKQVSDSDQDPVKINTDGLHIIREISNSKQLDELRVQDAIDTFSKAIRIKPEYVEPWNNRGRMHNLLKDYASGKADLEEAVRLNPEYKTAWANLAFSYEGLGEPSRALRAYWRSLEIDSTSVSPYSQPIMITEVNYRTANNLGALLNDQGKFGDAVDLLKQVIEIKPGVPNLHKNISRAYLGLGQVQESETHVDLALKIDPNYVDALNLKQEIIAARAAGN